MLPTYIPTNCITKTVKRGHLEMLIYFFDNDYTAQSPAISPSLHEDDNTSYDTDYLWRVAAKAGHLDIIKYVYRANRIGNLRGLLKYTEQTHVIKK